MTTVKAHTEIRSLRGLEIRRDEDGGESRIRGHAAVFNSMSEDLGGFREVVLSTAFDSALDGGDDVRALVDHDPGKVIGRNKSGTLELEKDARGLLVTINPPQTSVGRDLIKSITRGDIDAMSFGFQVPRDGEYWEIHEGEDIRYLTKVKLREVSVVAFPAYTDTDIAVRSLSVWKSSEWKPNDRTRAVMSWLRERNKE
jgi:HK97 family phage prohead protease